jgi:hypothetical protein
MGTYLMALREWLAKHKESVDKERRRAEKLEQQVAQLKISETERKNLQAEISALRQAPASPNPPVFVSTNTGFPFVLGSESQYVVSGLNFNPNYVDSEVVKTCPNGHLFKVPRYAVAVLGHQCPECTAKVF